MRRNRHCVLALICILMGNKQQLNQLLALCVIFKDERTLETMKPLPWGFCRMGKSNNWSEEWDLWSVQSVPLSVSETVPRNREDRGQEKKVTVQVHRSRMHKTAQLFGGIFVSYTVRCGFLKWTFVTLQIQICFSLVLLCVYRWK